MCTLIQRQLTDTFSLFWRIYEYVSAFILVVFIVLFSVVLWNSIAPIYDLFTLQIQNVFWFAPTLVGTLSWIIAADFVKFILTRSPRDNPLRKWFSFRWAQKFKSNEVVVLPSGYEGDRSELRFTRCKRCGVFHGFKSDEIKDRLCQFNRCKETIIAPVLDTEATSGETISSVAVGKDDIGTIDTRTRRDPDAIFDEINFTPLRWAFKHAWVISEYAFKLAAWMTIAAAVAALGTRLENQVIVGFGVALAGLWIVALAATLFKTTGYVFDSAHNKWVHGYKHREYSSVFISVILTGIFVLPMMHLLFLLIAALADVFASVGVSLLPSPQDSQT